MEHFTCVFEKSQIGFYFGKADAQQDAEAEAYFSFRTSLSLFINVWWNPSWMIC